MKAFRRGGSDEDSTRVHRAIRGPDWILLQDDLAAAVTAAMAGDEDVTVAFLEVDGDRRTTRVRRGRNSPDADTELRRLLATVRRCFGNMAVYRLGRHSLAVVGRAVEPPSMGERILLATVTATCRFHWGTASLRRLGARAVETPQMLVVLARADLRHRSNALAGGHVAFDRRRLATVGSVAAAAVLLAGAAFALASSPGTVPIARQAQPARPAPASPPSLSTPASTPPVSTVPASPAPRSPATAQPAPEADAAPSASGNVVLVGYTPTEVPSTVPSPTVQSPASPWPAVQKPEPFHWSSLSAAQQWTAVEEAVASPFSHGGWVPARGGGLTLTFGGRGPPAPGQWGRARAGSGAAWL